MNISNHADYACRVLIYLASIEGAQVQIREISAAYNISNAHLVKIVHELAQLGFVATTRGRGGGIRLARPATEITVGEIFRKMEPQQHIVECFDDRTNQCAITPACGIKRVLGRAMAKFLEELDGVTFADVTQKKKQLLTSLAIK